MHAFHEHEPGTAAFYRLSEHGPGLRLSPHFALIEFACKDGSDEVLVHPALIEGLERLRAELGGEPIHITSGYRTVEHNRRIGGSMDSRHLYGMAADIFLRRVPPRYVANVAEHLGFGGVGRYGTWTHVDVYGKDRRWGSNTVELDRLMS